MKRFVPDERWATAPRLPTDRPPTRAEWWAYCRHFFYDLKTHKELVAHARDRFNFTYAYWVNLRGWDKHPDWSPGDPVIPSCIPGPIDWPDHQKLVTALTERVKTERRRAA